MKSVIILDIGTQFVKAVNLEIDNNKKGIVKFWVKEPSAKDIFPVCQSAIKKLQKQSRVKAQEIFLGVGEDILRGKAITACFKREDPRQKIDLAELKYFIQKIEWKALDNIRKEFKKETEFKDTEARLIDAFIVDVKLDGRPPMDLMGATGQNICFSVYNIYSSCNWFKELERFALGLKLNLAGLVPNSFALFHYLDSEKNLKGNILIIDIGGKTTEITLVKNSGEVIETKNFHLGGQVFSRVLADFLGLKQNDAEKIKIKYSNGEVGMGAKQKLDKIFTSNMSSWMNGVRIILGDFLKEHQILPTKIIICGRGSKFPLIESTLKKEKSFKITNIENDAEFEQTPCPALKRFYLDLPDEKNIFVPIFKRVIKLIQSQ